MSPNSRQERRGNPLTGRIWRREHADQVVAEVVPVEGLGTWHVCTRYTGAPERRESDDRSYMMLVEAHAAADALARDAFGHVCDVRCGTWLQIERRRADDACD